MLAKSLLVYWLLVGRGDVQIQYAVRYPDETTCQTEALKVEQKNKGGFNSYPVAHATCVMDVSVTTPPPKK